MITNRDKLLGMTSEEFAAFLFQVAETGTQYFLDAVCEHCTSTDCPPESGCLFTPQEMIKTWLQQ